MKIFQFFILSLLLITTSSCDKKIESKTIIFILGTSSIGKSSVTNALQNKLKNNWVKISDDDYFMQLYLDEKIFSNYPHNKNIYTPNDILYAIKKENGDNELIIGPKWVQMSEVIPHSLVSYLNYGFNIVNDSLIQNEEQLKIYKDIFKNHTAIFVYLYSDLEVIEKREKQRGNRLSGTGKYWLSKINIQNSCDLKIDTTNLTPDEVAEKILVLLIDHD